MRPCEILLIVGNFLGFVVLVVPRLRVIGTTSSIVLITLASAVVQILVEGPRWQMVPTYILIGLFLLVWAVPRFVELGGAIKRFLSSRLVVSCAIVLSLLDLLLSAALPTALPIFHFPRPNGPYQIGTLTYHWVESRHELFSTNPRAPRELMAQIWYPVKRDSSLVLAPYVQDAGALSFALARVLHLPGFTFDYFQEIPTHAIPSAPVADDKPNYSVLIFLTGMTGYRQSNTFQVEELVSHGYIVVGIDQPYAAATVVFPDGHQILGWTRDQMQPLIQQSLSPVAAVPIVGGQALTNGIIPYFAQDAIFTLDRLTALNMADPDGLLTGRLDLEHVGTFGVSLGAMVASEACHQDARLKACLMMDAAMPADVVEAGLQQPSMWIIRPADAMRLEKCSETDIAQTLTTMQAVFKKEPVGDGYYVSVSGMFHANFTDAPYFTPLAPLLGFAGPMNAQRGFDIINAYSLAFFDQHLEGHWVALLDGPAKQYPEVLFSSRGIGQNLLP
jgi:pimeloyl-ACP methyl ester carboxylesterase